MNKKEGMTNGVGKSKPVFNPEGFINGNSKGMTNGMGGGFTNGMGESGIKPKSVFQKKRSIWQRLIPLFIVVILVGSAVFLFHNEASDSRVVKIDGEFGEWNNYTEIGFANIQFIDEGSSLYIGMERDNIFMGDGNITESYLIFINDRTSEDGYYLAYDTYEYYIDVFGTNHKTKDARGFQFDNSKDKNDWNGFSSRFHYFSLSRVNDENHMELRLNSIQIGRTELSDMDFLVYHFDTNGDYEYSQILDYDVMTGKGVEQTRVQPHMYWHHNFDENILEINTDISLAYSSIDYNIRIVEDELEIEEENTEDEIVQEPVVAKPHEMPEYKQKIKGTKLLIDYDFFPQDVIWQCGGTIINTTANATLNDDGFIIYNINHTVVECKIEGDFGIQYIQEENTRGKTNLLSLGLPIATPLYNASEDYRLIATWTDNAPTIDGELNEDAWNGVGLYIVDATRDIKILASMNETKLFIGIMGLNDTNPENLDVCQLCFDVGHNETTTPDTNDKKIRLRHDNTTTYYEGDGSGWSVKTAPSNCSAKSWITNGRPSWEFEIDIQYMNEYGHFNSTEDYIGFGVHVMDYDGGTMYHTCYPDNEDVGIPTVDYTETPNYWADLYDGSSTDMTAYYTSGTAPTIDGTLSANEWDDADTYTVDLTRDLKLYAMNNGTHVFIALDSLNDGTSGSGDTGNVYFDCDHDATSNPDTNDKRLRRNGSETYYEGDGSSWSSTSKPSGWSSARGMTSGNRSWEFRIPISDLNETGDFWQNGDEIGFGCAVLNSAGGSSFWVWWPDGYKSGGTPPSQLNDPDTWGDLMHHIPEFSDILIIIPFLLIMNFVVFAKRRRGDADA